MKHVLARWQMQSYASSSAASATQWRQTSALASVPLSWTTDFAIQCVLACVARVPL